MRDIDELSPSEKFSVYEQLLLNNGIHINVITKTSHTIQIIEPNNKGGRNKRKTRKTKK
jgi:hypothetical protein